MLKFDKKEENYIRKTASELFSYQYHSAFYYDTYLYSNTSYKTNITISKKQGVSEPWIIATNSNPKRAIKDYDYRFGDIESIFKKSKI